MGSRFKKNGSLLSFQTDTGCMFLVTMDGTWEKVVGLLHIQLGVCMRRL